LIVFQQIVDPPANIGVERTKRELESDDRQEKNKLKKVPRKPRHMGGGGFSRSQVPNPVSMDHIAVTTIRTYAK
jgi:hypothetical protein